MSDFAFNWAGVAYDTGKPNRSREQVIRIVPKANTLKAQYDLASYMLQPPTYSDEDLQVQDAQEEELAVIIGELLPQDFEYNYPENPLTTRFFDFGRQDLIVPTQGSVGYVIEALSSPTRRFFLLCDERINRVRVVKRLGGLPTTEIRDRLFFYPEFSTCGIRTKLGRWGAFTRNIKDFQKRYLQRRNIEASGPGHT
ncbi:hypothetical protein NW768_006564 [Fusarium equiseti]|uniref:Uncharacterized protein n=1 Tax=Fusarium equiseti TaxID=61235 RepID=A0ABQ8RBU6_FUSEQ|nr:hypothetical protein NW768_006564 [Fusarium equiseti]